jgi:hypothetical protein
MRRGTVLQLDALEYAPQHVPSANGHMAYWCLGGARVILDHAPLGPGLRSGILSSLHESGPLLG